MKNRAPALGHPSPPPLSAHTGLPASDHAVGAEEDGGGVAKRIADFVQRSKFLQDAAFALSSRIRNEEQSLSQQALALDKEIASSHRDISAALASDRITALQAEKLEDDLYKAKCMVSEGDIAALLPRKSKGGFLRMMLGPVNLCASSNDVRLKVKEEYNAYKDRTAILFIVFPSLLFFLNNWLWDGCLPALPVHLYQAWLLFFYTGLALRENVLRVNGSDIRPWWIYHHYCAMMMALVSLTWDFKGPTDCQHKQHGVRLFLVWAVIQGFAMLLQNRYQRQRLYTRIALGKAGRMDVVGGETAAISGQLLLLYPVLFILQGFQGYIGVRLMRAAYFEVDSEWQVFACSLLLLTMAAGNFINTIETVVAKVRIKAKKGRKSLLKTPKGRSTDSNANVAR